MTDRKLLFVRAAFTFVLAFMVAPLAHAADVTINCVPPTSYTDNTPISAGTVITFKIYGALQGVSKQLLDTKTTCAFTRTNVAVGTQCYDVTASVAGAESAHPAEVCKTVAPPVPNPPTLVTITQLAYSVIKSEGLLVLLPVGKVPAGTSCDSSQGVLKDGVTYSVVPTKAIVYSGTARPVVAVAACG